MELRLPSEEDALALIACFRSRESIDDAATEDEPLSLSFPLYLFLSFYVSLHPPLTLSLSVSRSLLFLRREIDRRCSSGRRTFVFYRVSSPRSSVPLRAERSTLKAEDNARGSSDTGRGKTVITSHFPSVRAGHSALGAATIRAIPALCVFLSATFHYAGPHRDGPRSVSGTSG